ncbi:MAG: RimK family alpha-L-glutamate ligase, partial [Halobacteriales archaeon]
MTDGDSVTVGVLSLHTSKETKAILNAVEDLGHDPVWLRQENTVISISDGEVALEPDVDVVANRLLLTNTEQPAEGLGLAGIFAALRPMLNRPPATMTAVHKFATAAVLSEAGLPVPDALLALSTKTFNADRTSFGPEAVYKTAIGTHGGGTWKVSTADNLNPTIGNRRAFLQELIDLPDRPHRDLRVYVVGDRVVGAMYRYAPEGDWRTNVALGGAVEDATDDLTDEVRQLAIDSATTIGLDYAGVDIV